MRKTLVVAGVHEAETEFGNKVIDKYKKIAKKADSVEIFFVPDNQGSNNNDYEKENQSYAQVLSAIQNHNPDFVIDIHHGWHAKINPYYIALIKDPFMARKYHKGDAEEFWHMIKRQGINPGACGDYPRPPVLRPHSTFTLMTIETMLQTEADDFIAEDLSPQERHNYLSAGIRKDIVYDRAVEHTASVVNFLHAEFKQRFPHLLKTI